MTAITPTEVSVLEHPSDVKYGTGKRRATVIVRATTGVDYTLDLSTYVPGIADIEGVLFSTDDGAVTSTVPTWSTYTVTTKMAGTGEMGFMVTLN